MCHLEQNPELQKHTHNTKMKVASRINLLKKLSNSKWGCNASTIRTTALALSYSTAECACPVWARSPYASKLDPEPNDACGKEETGNKRSPLSTRPDSSREMLEERMLP